MPPAEDAAKDDTVTGTVDYQIENEIAVITIDNPPVNALSQAVRAGLDAAFVRFADDPSARIAVILGTGRLFCGGADINEFGQPSRGPFLRDIVNRIEASQKPVIAAIHGTALGGGLEVAMGAHYRLALPGSRLGLPEVLLGLMPGAGGTQRLSRLVDTEDALEMMTSGAPIGADRALTLGLVDRLGKTDDVRAEGLEFATDLLARAAPPRPVSAMRPPDIDDEDIHRWRVRLTGSARGHVAPLAIVDAVEVASGPKFAAGLNEERKLYRDLMETPQRAALVHAFMADRKLGALPELAGVTARRLRHLGIVGGGTVGTALATAALANGLRVTLIVQDRAGTAQARERIAGLIDTEILRGRLDASARDAVLTNALTITTTPDAAQGTDMVIEAVPEDMVSKLAILDSLDRLCKPDAVLASTTATLDLNALAAGIGHPERLIGLHPFAPPPDLRVIEVVPTWQTAPEVTATVFALAKRLGRRAVRAAAGAGYIGNRITARCLAAADRMMLHGASPYQIDTALCDFGLALGPYQQADLIGIDRLPATDTAAADIRAALCRNGWRGRDAGRGFYRYDTGDPEGLPDPEVEMLVARARHDAGVVPRRLTDNEVIRRHIAALVNEAARVLAEGIAARPLDIDMVFVHGGGFPRWRGGPMHYADRVGPGNILADIHRYAETDPQFWQAAPLLTDMVGGKKTFAGLNRA